MPRTHQKSITVKLFNDDQSKIDQLKKTWKLTNYTHVYRKAIDESLRNEQLHNEINSLKKQLIEQDEKLDYILRLARDVYLYMADKDTNI